MWRAIIFITLWCPIFFFQHKKDMETPQYTDIQIHGCKSRCSERIDMQQQNQNEQNIDIAEQRKLYKYYQSTSQISTYYKYCSQGTWR